MPLNLNVPQFEFYSMEKQFRAFVGGYRSGKTFLGCVRLCALSLQYPGIKLGYFAPTYPQISDIFYSTIEEVSEMSGMECSIKTSTKEVTLSYYGDVHSVIKCRSMEHPSRIVGFDINHALIDEIDTMKKDKADQAWKKIIARLSSTGFDEQRLFDEELNSELIIEALGENTVDFTTTPEGFGWIYDLFVKQLNNDDTLSDYYGIVHASTRQNRKNLAEGYIEALYATYPENLVDAYIDGKFVNLTSGTVYSLFDRDKHDTNRVWNGREPVHIGMDFNVCNMSAIITVIDKNKCYDVDEIVGAYDTPSIIQIIKERYQRCQVNIYPDASGKNRNAQGASESSIQLLRQAGFNVFAPNKNPFVKDRVLAMNTSFSKGYHYVNISKCPNHAENLEQQVYNSAGEPDKTQGKDHTNDANGYFISYKYPVVKPVVKKTRLLT